MKTEHLSPLSLILGMLIAGTAFAYGEEPVPAPPDYKSPTMWYRADEDQTGNGADIFYIVSTWEEDWTMPDGRTCHWADVWNADHRRHMGIEIRKAASYMGPGNRFYAPYYRHATIDGWVTQNEDTIERRAKIAMQDVRDAFDHFLATRDSTRPLILAGFSQGGMAVVELLRHMDAKTYGHLAAAYVMGYKVTAADTATYSTIRPARGKRDVGAVICYNTVKDTCYVKPVISASAVGINPVNWRTDERPARLHDTITVRLSAAKHVVVVSGYSGSEYKPYRDLINVGDIHSCEPWPYSENIARNMRDRTRAWRKAKGKR